MPSLRGIKVVDLTTNVAGPFATQILGDLGADVVKVERPQGGDDTRAWGPPFWPSSLSTSFTSLNRNKRSIALDLRAEADRDVLDRLLERADVLVQNMRPGAFAALGYDAARLDQLNPRLVYCEITGFGHTGPRSLDAAYDPLIQAYSGLMSFTGHPDGEPVRIPVSVLDKGTGMWAVIGILDALNERERTGRGVKCDVSLLSTALDWEAGQIASYLADGSPPTPAGSGTQGIAPYQAFRASDGHLVIAAGNDRLWVRLCDALGMSGLARDGRYLTNADRVRNLSDLVPELTAVTSTRSVAELVELLTAAGVPCNPILDIPAMLREEQVGAIGAVSRRGASEAEACAVVSLPIRMDGSAYDITRLPPLLDADRESVLADLDTREPADRSEGN